MDSTRSEYAAWSIGYIDRPGGIRQKRKVEGLFRISQGVVVVREPRGGGRDLASGHSVIQVVDAHHGDVDVPAGCMDEMIAADGKKIPVSAEHDDLQLRVGQLDSVANGMARPWVVKGIQIGVYPAARPNIRFRTP